MTIKPIITVPNEVLKKISDPIENVGESEKKLVNDLFETMYNSNGIGLAAVQVGILKRILVIDVSAIFVATTIFLHPFGVFLNTSACLSQGRLAYMG